MRKASQKSWFNGLLSLLFALLLFFNANATGNNPSNSGSSQTYSETLNNIPVQVQYDKDKYYVSGFEQEYYSMSHYTFGLNLNWRDYCLLHWH